MRPLLLAVAATAAVAGTAASQQPPAATPSPSIAGHWTYNVEQSTDPRSMTQFGDSGQRPEGGGRGGRFRGGRGGFGGERRGGGGMSDEQRARMRQTMQLVWDAPQALAIAQTDSSVSLAADTAQAVVLAVNGHKVVIKSDSLADVEVRGKWQGNDFVVQRKVSGGGTVTEDYLHSSYGNQLFVIVSFDTPSGRSIQFRRVYDAAP